jgi:DNA-binding transcriptional ArsR family regulator
MKKRTRNHGQLDEAQLQAVAELFSVLSESSRLQILQALQAGPLSVGELVDRSGLKQANVSKQLGLLMSAGVIDRRQDGNGQSIRFACRWCSSFANWSAGKSPSRLLSGQRHFGYN